MKVTVWTKPDYDRNPIAQAKCVFVGNISAIPQKDIGIVVRDGFCVASIDHIYYNLVNDSVEIGLETTDHNNEYPEVDYKTGKESD